MECTCLVESRKEMERRRLDYVAKDDQKGKTLYMLSMTMDLMGKATNACYTKSYNESQTKTWGHALRYIAIRV